MSLIANLAMYDWPEVRGALDHFWERLSQQLRDNGFDAPPTLYRPENDMQAWLDPNLLVGQTCGWPYANLLRGKVVAIARIDYDLKDCPPGFYNSVFIGQKPEDAEYIQSGDAIAEVERVAINGLESQSGFRVFTEISGRPAIETIPQQRQWVTGAHRQSVLAVANGEAQIAAIDHVAFELAKRYEPDAVSEVHVLGYSKPVPGLPLITTHEFASKQALITEVIKSVLHQLPPEISRLLMMKNLIEAEDSDYDIFLLYQ